MSTATLPTVQCDKYAAVPEELKQRDQWVLWKYETRLDEKTQVLKKTKVPIQISGRYASSTNPKTWNTFENCVRNESKADGIGFVLRKDTGIVGVDLDKVRNPDNGQIESWAKSLVDKLNSYTEISPRGRGLHVFVRGKLVPGGGNKSGRVEMYDDGRFFTVTGTLENPLRDTRIREIDAKALQSRLRTLDPAPRAPTSGGAHTSVAARENDPSREDYQIIGQLRRKYPEATPEEIEEKFEEKFPEQYASQNDKHGKRGEKTYIRYSIERQIKADERKANVIEMPTRATVTVASQNVPSITESSVRPDMPEGVLDGRLGEIYQKRLNSFPIAYAWPALVTLGGALVPSQEIAASGLLTKSRSPFRTTLYAALVGPVETGKSQSVEQAAMALGVVPPTLLALKAGSAEGLAPKLNVSGEARVLSPDELGHLLDKSAIQGASFSRVLNSLYYHDREDLIMAKGKSANINCRLSLIGGVVEEDFENVFGASTTHGLYSRMIFGLCPEPWQYLYRPFEGGVEQTKPKPAAFHPDVWDARDEWVKTHGMHGRDAENALRIAYICACFDGRDLRAKDLGPAFEMVKYQARFRQMFVPNVGLTYDAQAGNRLMTAVEAETKRQREAGATENPWINLRRLQQRTGIDKKYGRGILTKTVHNLVGNNELEFETRGKKSKFVRLIDHDCEP